MMVKCMICGRELSEEVNNYITVKGNIYVGNKGGIVGDNFPKNKQEFIYDDIHEDIFCFNCFQNMIQEAKERVDEQITDKIDKLKRHLSFNNIPPVGAPISHCEDCKYFQFMPTGEYTGKGVVQKSMIMKYINIVRKICNCFERRIINEI